MLKSGVFPSRPDVGTADDPKPNQDYLGKLNKAQRSAVEHGVTGEFARNREPLLVIAGAGTGKTATLSHRAAHLVVNGVKSNRVMLLTFTRKAAAEMNARARKIVATASGGQITELSWAGTFHSIGARILREYATRIGISPSFTILDRSDAADLMDLVRAELGYSQTKKKFPRKDTCLSIYSSAVNSEKSLKRTIAERYPAFKQWRRELRSLFQQYVARKKSQNVLDYDDLLVLWAELMDISEVGDMVRKRFDHVLVDEFQDTNSIQSRIVRSIRPTGQGIMVVGDDAQSIYSFRGADIRNILDFPKQFEVNGRVVRLIKNYRSTQPILNACNAVIGLSDVGFRKNLKSDKSKGELPSIVIVGDEEAQAQCVAKHILAQREGGVPLADQAVLFRASHHSARLEIELATRNIPFKKFGGGQFMESAHVKDVMAILRWAENPSDQCAAFRVLKILPHIGQRTAAKILDQLPKVVGKNTNVPIPPATRPDWFKLLKLLSALRRPKSKWPADLDLVRRWYETHLVRMHEDAEQRREDLDQLEQIAATFGSRSEFLTELTLDPPLVRKDGKEPDDGEEDDYLTLSTIHSAKGLEWQNVTVLNSIDGCIPSSKAASDEEIEEERRLLYVAMTRAKAKLRLTCPAQIYARGTGADTHTGTSITKFIPKSLLPLFRQKGWGGKDQRVYLVEGGGESVDIMKQFAKRFA